VGYSDMLNIRSGAGVSNPVIGSFARNATNVMRTGPVQQVDGAEWVEVLLPNGGDKGWVNSYYLTEYVTHETFCADTRISVITGQLKQAVNQSDGNLFASIVSPLHGANIDFWRNGTTVNYTPLTAQSIFTNAQVIDWGYGASGIHDTGTFAQIVQPDMAVVLNSDYKLFCDDSSYAGALYLEPWGYTNIHYYAVLKPPTPGIDVDWKIWLVGFEYVNSTPSLFGAVHYIWEP
jgi:hypothetical protein